MRRPRRLLRHAFTLCSAISLVLLLGVAALAIHGKLTPPGAPGEQVWRWSHPHRFRVLLNNSVVTHWKDSDQTLSLQPRALIRRSQWEMPGLQVMRVTAGGSWSMTVIVRRGLLAACTAPLPLAWLGSRAWATRKRRVRTRAGLCADCGYDLRAHQSGERCPECGTAVA